MNKMVFNPVCIFLTIVFCENLQEYFFVQNQFLILKITKKMLKYYINVIFWHAKILHKFNILC